MRGQPSMLRRRFRCRRRGAIFLESKPLAITSPGDGHFFCLRFNGDPMPEHLQIVLSQPSTWRGIVHIVAALGIGVSPDQLEAIVMAGLAVSGAIGVFCSDAKGGQ